MTVASAATGRVGDTVADSARRTAGLAAECEPGLAMMEIKTPSFDRPQNYRRPLIFASPQRAQRRKPQDMVLRLPLYCNGAVF